MFPNLSLDEQFMFERHQELQREMAKLRLVARLPRHHSSVRRRLARGVGTILLALGTRLKEFESGGEQGVYEQSNAQESTMNRTTVT